MVTRIEKPIIVQGDSDKVNLGLVHVITGSGKGKTTSSLGTALRAIGAGYKVFMIQFLKSGMTSELYAAKHLPNFTIEQFGVDAVQQREKAQAQLSGFVEKDTTGRFVFQPDTNEKDTALLGFARAKEIILSEQYDVVILDEINCVLDKGLIPMEEVIALIKNNKKTELLLTGRDAPSELQEYAHYVSEIYSHKHPWQKGIKARKGIEY